MRVDTRYYNRENLKKEDRQELDFWRKVVLNVIDNTLFDYQRESGILSQIQAEIAKEFSDALKVDFGYRLMDVLTGYIDNYEEDLPERDEFTTYFYDNEKEGKEHENN